VDQPAEPAGQLLQFKADCAEFDLAPHERLLLPVHGSDLVLSERPCARHTEVARSIDGVQPVLQVVEEHVEVLALRHSDSETLLRHRLNAPETTGCVVNCTFDFGPKLLDVLRLNAFCAHLAPARAAQLRDKRTTLESNTALSRRTYFTQCENGKQWMT
jgi:hypothetical protein